MRAISLNWCAIVVVSSLVSCGDGKNAKTEGGPQPSSVVIQRWTAPTSWGGLWPSSPTMVQHAWFDGAGIVEDPATGIQWSVPGGTPPARREFKGFPSGSRFGAGPFTDAQQRYQANAGSDAALDALTGDMLVCAIVKPDYNPTSVVPGGDDHERPIIARGVGHDSEDVLGGGWVLMQMHSYFCFHYEYLDGAGNSKLGMAIVPTYFADQNALPSNGPLNPSYVVFCAGRSGDTIRAAVNGVELDPEVFPGSSMELMGTGPFTLDKGSHPTTIGAYDDARHPADHLFGGRIYETAVWNEPATPENIRAKLAAIQGIGGDGSTYVRNREAWLPGADGLDHAVAWNGPRIDPVKGALFGLQGWNRLSRWTSGTEIHRVLAPGEDMGVWERVGSATVAAVGTVEPPGDSERASAKLVTLPAGSSLRTTLGAFDADGPIHGQIWLRLPGATTGTLRLAVSNPAPGGSSTFDVDLSSIAPGAWTRIWLRRGTGGSGNELTTSGAAGTFSLVAPATNAAPIQLYAWGLDLTQIGALPAANGGGGGVDLGDWDPGQAMYDWSGPNATTGYETRVPVDALVLPRVPASTAANGFCLAFDGTMPAGLPWSAPFTRRRTAVAWLADPLGDTFVTSAMIYVDGARETELTPNPGQLCFRVTNGTPVCAAMPASFTPGSTRAIKACMSPGGDVSLYADGGTTPIASGSAGVPAPDLSGGALLVGSSRALPIFESNPWHGFISKAVVCHGGDPAGCQ